MSIRRPKSLEEAVGIALIMSVAIGIVIFGILFGFGLIVGIEMFWGFERILHWLVP